MKKDNETGRAASDFVSPGAVSVAPVELSGAEADIYFMGEALKQARLAADADEVPVGAVIVRDGRIIAAACNSREADRDATCHAECSAIRAACKALGGWRLVGCTMYVTLEPCPMCAGAAVNARLPRIVIGARDPKAGAFGSVTDLNALPLNHKPELTFGVMEDRCADMLRSFFRKKREK
jgi:tRNA(adenine34) deaminase